MKLEEIRNLINEDTELETVRDIVQKYDAWRYTTGLEPINRLQEISNKLSKLELHDMFCTFASEDEDHVASKKCMLKVMSTIAEEKHKMIDTIATKDIAYDLINLEKIKSIYVSVSSGNNFIQKIRQPTDFIKEKLLSGSVLTFDNANQLLSDNFGKIKYSKKIFYVALYELIHEDFKVMKVFGYKKKLEYYVDRNFTGEIFAYG